MSDSPNTEPHISERLKMWRSRDLKPTFVATLDKIEQFGWSVLHVLGDAAAPRFSYTVGVFDMFGHPEIISVGLTEKMAQFALNKAVRLMRSGVDLTIGRHREIVGEVECKFCPVDRNWMHHVMGRADWYYEGEDVPVLQLIYPDLENRFQTDEGFTEYFRQPILSGQVEKTRLEEDFWAANDPSSSLSRWKFPDNPHTNAYLSSAVHEKEESITYVSHDADDGAWQFLGDTMCDSGGVLSCLHHPIDDDATLEELADLPLGWYATRENSEAPWQRFEQPPEEPDENSPAT